ncbi:MAG TPA: MFS transporter [Gemmataceae bacterium]|nr:MFS transporter [Gemmataceae bacterium]
MGGTDLRQISRGQWLALAAALLGWMFDGFEQGVLGVVGRPALIDVLHLKEEDRLAATASDRQVRQQAKERVDSQSGAWNSGLAASFLIGAALGGWLFGWLGDRLGRVRGMVFSVLTYASFTGLCGLAQDPWQLAALRFLASLGMGGEWALGVALVMESWPQQMRPLLAGLIGAAANVGFLLTAVMVEGVRAIGVQVDAGGWRWVLGLCALPALLTFFLRVFVPESEKWQQAARTAPRPSLTAIFTPALRRHSILAATLSGIPLIVTWAGVAWMVPHWVDSLPKEAAWINAAAAQASSAVGAIFGALTGALLAHYFGRRRTYFTLTAGSLLICAYLFRGYFPSGTPAKADIGLLWVIGLTGFFTASFYGWLPLYLPELFPTRVRATGQGFGYNFGRIIAAAGALYMSHLLKNVFHGDYAQAGAVISLIYLAGLIVIWFAPETRGQPLPE